MSTISSSANNPFANLGTVGSATTAAANAAGTAAAAQVAKGSAADTENRFLKLLVAQLKNQDPLNPMDNAAVTSQMAQISTVNGIQSLNNAMTDMTTGFAGLQTLQAAALAGRQVAISGTGLTLADGSATGGFSLASPADNVTVSIFDAAGALLQKVDLGAQKAGVQTFEWDGATDNGGTAAAGRYRFAVQARTQGVEQSVEPWQLGTVQGVRPNGGSVMLSVGGQGEVALADVKKIF